MMRSTCQVFRHECPLSPLWLPCEALTRGASTPAASASHAPPALRHPTAAAAPKGRPAAKTYRVAGCGHSDQRCVAISDFRFSSVSSPASLHCRSNSVRETCSQQMWQLHRCNSIEVWRAASIPSDVCCHMCVRFALSAQRRLTARAASTA